MIHCLVLRVDPDGRFAKVGATDVADTNTAPGAAEKAAWAAYSRGRKLPPGQYAAVRAGELFTVQETRGTTTADSGAMT